LWEDVSEEKVQILFHGVNHRKYRACPVKCSVLFNRGRKSPCWRYIFKDDTLRTPAYIQERYGCGGIF
jgi:hypothetical protein